MPDTLTTVEADYLGMEISVIIRLFERLFNPPLFCPIACILVSAI
jgi:hypothetical protein